MAKKSLLIILAYPLHEQIAVGHLDVLQAMFENALKIFDEVHVVSPRDARKYDLGPRIFVHSIRSFGPRTLSLFLDGLKIAKIVKKNNIVLIRTLDTVSGFSARVASKKTGVPYIVSLHRDRALVEKQHGIKRNWFIEKMIVRAEKKVLQDAVFIPVVSEYIRNVAINKGAKKEKTVLHHNFVDLNLYVPGKNRRNQIIFVGRLDRAKGADILIRSVPSILEKCDVDLKIVGSGPEEENLKNLTKDLGISKKVEFAGRVIHDKFAPGSLPWRLSESKIFVSPALSGFTLMEAMACGCPVIAADIEWTKEIVQNGKNGILVEQNPEQIADAAIKLLKDYRLWKTMAENARKTAARFSLENWKKRELEIYKRALG